MIYFLVKISCIESREVWIASILPCQSRMNRSFLIKRVTAQNSVSKSTDKEVTTGRIWALALEML